jgi:tetratricopeptide (TPR) repeat protein
LDSNDYETCFFIGKAYLNSPTPEKGLFFYNRVDSLLQADPLIISTLYAEKQSIYSAINKYPEALNSYELAYKYNPKPEYLFFIASMYQNNLHDKKSAYTYYNRFIEQLPPKPDSEHIYDENQITVSLRKVAESNIEKLKEELFFEGELPK